MNKLLIIGAGGHGNVCYDIAKGMQKYNEILFLDDKVKTEKVIDIVSNYIKYINEYDFFVAIGNNKIRKKFIIEIENNGGTIATLIHNSAIIGSNVKIDIGSVIMPGVIINCNTIIGKGAIINTSASIDHDSSIGDFTHVSVGSHLAGSISVGQLCFICAGTVIINNISICDDVIIGAGGVVVNDIVKNGLYIGCPAKYKGE